MRLAPLGPEDIFHNATTGLVLVNKSVPDNHQRKVGGHLSTRATLVLHGLEDQVT